MAAKIKFFFEQSWLLLVASFAFGLLLALTNAAWQPRIQQNVIERFNRLAGALLDDAVDFEPATDEPLHITVNGRDEAVQVQRGLDADGRTVGWAFVCRGAGFADIIELVVAVDADFETLAGFRVLSSNETPGFGDKIEIAPEENGFFQSQFKGAPVTELTLSRTGDPEQIDDEIVAITGATVTSQAVVNMLNAWLEPIRETLKAEGILAQ